MGLVHAFLMTKKSKYSVELHRTWHLKSFRKLSTADLQPMFGLLVSYYLQFFLDNFRIEVQPMKLFMTKYAELIVYCRLKSKKSSVPLLKIS